jgi:hypothetical protein
MGGGGKGGIRNDFPAEAICGYLVIQIRAESKGGPLPQVSESQGGDLLYQRNINKKNHSALAGHRH